MKPKTTRPKRGGLNLTVLFDLDGFSPEDIENLWRQGVVLNDFDYIVLLPKSDVVQRNGSMLDLSTGTRFAVKEWKPKNPLLESVVKGSNGASWFRAELGGETVGIGIAYHN